MTSVVTGVSAPQPTTPKRVGLLPLEFADCLLDSPYFRENLRAHEKQLDQTSADIKGIIKDVQVNHKNFHIPTTNDCSYMYVEANHSLNRGVPLFFPTDSHP